ncbi:MAG TPA: DPP IV N-terminal domain-containing protein, partial [Flavobacterium sp.]|nr:DPP IV N-terminal domain-containing protein [Flavobacterium sp.]
MKKISILFLSLFLGVQSFGQLKKITLEESVLQQGRKFGADKLTGFQWIPNTNKYVYYTDAWTKMMTATTADAKTSELTTLADINAALGTKLKNFFGVQWMDTNTILVTENGKSYSYNLTTKSGKSIVESPENGENQTFDSSYKNLAFTEGNNLFFINDKKEKIAVTNNSDKNIVSGQSISRNEFGIAGGIFWSPKSSFLAFYQKDETDVADYPLLDITETPGKLVNIKYPMIGQKSEKPRVGIYNVATGKTVFI